jgi:hypothetical protein
MSKSFARSIVGAAVAAVIVAVPAVNAAQLGDIFYIALENHNFTQPSSYTSIQQLLGNPAAPYLNSLITPGNPNAAQVSYATNYTNAGLGVHPSEPNYVWAEAGTNFNPISTGAATATNQGSIVGNVISNDNDPTAANKNIFSNVPHLTGQLNSLGVTWKNYQEDYQITSSTALTGGSPLVSKSGTSALYTNAYNGSQQYNYAAKHNPMAFFTDTATQNVYPMSQLATDLATNNVGQYNWITPNQYNDMHSSLNTNFTYAGQTWTHNTDQEAVAIGDNYLSIIVPEIMASAAYQNNGAIVIWNDETEGGDTLNQTSTEIVISPLAKGNAYASGVALNHSSDIKTLEEVFGTGSYLNNAIETSATAAAGGYNTVAGSNDLSDLFQPGVIPTSVPEPTSAGLLAVGALALGARRRRA